MPTTAPRKSSEPAFTGIELFVLIALIAAGLGGAFIASQSLAALRTQSDAVQARLASLERSRTSKAGAAVAQPSNSTAESLAPNAVVEEVAVHASPATVRTQSLELLADLMSKRVVMGSGVPVGLAGPLGSGQRLPGYAIDGEGNLSPDFGELFGLGEVEVANLQALAKSAKEQVDRIVMANSTLEQVSPTSYKIEVAAAPEGAAVREQFIGAFRSALGEERYKAFALLNGEREVPAAAMNRVVDGVVISPPKTGPAALFSGFGDDKKTITVTKENGRYSYSIRSGSSNGSGSGGTLENYKARMGPAFNLLPEGF